MSCGSASGHLVAWYEHLLLPLPPIAGWPGHAPGRDIASRVCMAARHHRGHPASGGGGRSAGRGGAKRVPGIGQDRLEDVPSSRRGGHHGVAPRRGGAVGGKAVVPRFPRFGHPSSVVLGAPARTSLRLVRQGLLRSEKCIFLFDQERRRGAAREPARGRTPAESLPRQPLGTRPSPHTSARVSQAGVQGRGACPALLVGVWAHRPTLAPSTAAVVGGGVPRREAKPLRE